MAFIVIDWLTAIGPLYTVPTVSLGVVTPSVVYRMLAPLVPLESDTVCAEL
jgi:hypothetical protein